MLRWSSTAVSSTTTSSTARICRSAPPSQGGDAGDYQQSLSELLNILHSANAPADTVAYVEAVQKDVARTTAGEYVYFSLGVGNALSVPGNTVHSFPVGYKANEERDLIVEVLADQTVLSTARMHVAAGSGVANVTVKIGSRDPNGSFNYLRASLVPTGSSDAGKVASKDTFLFIQN